jgi:hypothetical protein
MCTRGPGLPQAPASDRTVADESWCIEIGALQRFDPDPTAEMDDLSTPHPRHGAFTIERPPRTFAS